MSENLVLAVQNAPVLHVLGAAPEPPPSIAGLASAAGRDKSNVAKSLKALREAGWVEGEDLALTAAGRALLPRLAALEGDAPEGDPAALTHAQIAPSPLNPRKDWTSDDAVAALDALRESILQEGLVQPIAVRRTPDANGVRIILAGERRWRAIGAAIADGDLPADHPIAVVLRDADDAAHRRLALIENLVRHDLHPLDEAEAFQVLRETMGVQELADLAKRTPRFIQQRIALLGLDPAQQDRMRLPADDPQHLTPTGARNLLQGHSELGATPVSPTGPLAEEDPFGDRAWLNGSKPSGGQMDIEELAPAALPAGLVPPRPPAMREPRPRERLMLVEIAWKVAHDPLPGPMGGYTASGHSYPDPSRLSNALVQEFGGGFVSGGGEPAGVHLGRSAADWLRREGLMVDGQIAPDVLFKERAKVLGNAEALKLSDSGRFATPWLNPEAIAEAAAETARNLARIKENKQQREEAEAAERARTRRRAAAAGALASFLNRPPELAAQRLRIAAALFREAGWVGPFAPSDIYENLVQPAEGEPVCGWNEDGEPDQLERALVALAFNLAAGVPPEQWPPFDPAPYALAAEDQDEAEEQAA